MANNSSHHILGTATNLLGFCLVVVTSIHLSDKADNSFIDEVAAMVAFMLAMSSIFSFKSILSKDEKKSLKLETLAEYLFHASLVGILIIIPYIFVYYISH